MTLFLFLLYRHLFIFDQIKIYLPNFLKDLVVRVSDEKRQT